MSDVRPDDSPSLCAAGSQEEGVAVREGKTVLHGSYIWLVQFLPSCLEPTTAWRGARALAALLFVMSTILE